MTLQPDDRMLLAEALAPPDGTEFDAAMAVTYSLDLRALLAVPMALSHSDLAGAAADAVDVAVAAVPEAASPSGDVGAAVSQGPAANAPRGAGSEAERTPVALLAALKRCAGRLTVMAQGGHISAPPTARRIFSFLEDSVIEVNAPRGGVVHAKAWVLRYRMAGDGPASSGGSHLRVLLSSRNLTYDRNWDTIIRFDAFLDAAHRSRASDPKSIWLDGLADLFEGLLRVRAPGDGTGPPDRLARHRERVASLCTDLRDAEFARPDGFDGARLHVLGLDAEPPSNGGAPFDRPFPDDSTRSLVISPFVRAGFFSNVLPRCNAELVARASELQHLDVCALRSQGHVGAVAMFDAGAQGESDEAASEWRDETTAPADEAAGAVGPRHPAPSLSDLHAKLYAFDRPRGRSSLFIGSANATNSAFRRNVEMLLQLDGPTRKVGIDALTGAPDASLRRFFVPYEPAEPEPGPPPGVDVDRVVRHLAATLGLTGSISMADGRATLRIRSEGPVSLRDGLRGASSSGEEQETGGDSEDAGDVGNVDDAAGWSISIRPLSPVPSRPVPIGAPLDLAFEIALGDVSTWCLVEITSPDGASVSRLLQIEMVDVPVDFENARDTEIMRRLVGNGDRLMEYLVELMRSSRQPIQSERPDRPVEPVQPRSPTGRDGATDATRRLAPAPATPMLEAMLRTGRTDPGRLLSLLPLVESFTGAAPGQPVSTGLPERFTAVWRTVLLALSDEFEDADADGPKPPGYIGAGSGPRNHRRSARKRE